MARKGIELTESAKKKLPRVKRERALGKGMVGKSGRAAAESGRKGRSRADKASDAARKAMGLPPQAKSRGNPKKTRRG